MRILITGKNGYVGNSFKNWITENKKNIEIDFISIKNDDYKTIDYSIYSSIIHLAAIVHKNEKNISLDDFLNVNFEKTKEIFNKAIQDNVNQFIFISSMAVFGNNERIDHSTSLIPLTKYGISKKKAEDYLIKRNKETNLAILRPPMIYGRNSPGNPRLIEKLSQWLFFFPNIKNKRSFIEINELCSILFDVIVNKTIGIIHPSNKIMSTFDLFKFYRGSKKIYGISFFNPIIKFLLRFSIIEKIFGNLFYDFPTNISSF